MKSIGKIIKNVLYVIIVICCVSIGGTKLLTGKASMCGYMPIFIATGSMEPTIHAKSFILMRSIKPEDVRVGDIVAYKYTKNKLSAKIVHRVIKITPDGNFIFKGDANATTDPEEVTPKQILYKDIS